MQDPELPVQSLACQIYLVLMKKRGTKLQGFRVQDLGFRVRGLRGFGFRGLGFRVLVHPDDEDYRAQKTFDTISCFVAGCPYTYYVNPNVTILIVGVIQVIR